MNITIHNATDKKLIRHIKGYLSNSDLAETTDIVDVYVTEEGMLTKVKVKVKDFVGESSNASSFQAVNTAVDTVTNLIRKKHEKKRSNRHQKPELAED